MECTVCKQIKQPTKEQKHPCYPCDLCRNIICMECTELSPSEIKCLPLQKRLLKFQCKNCRNDLVTVLQNTVKDKETIIENLEEIIRLLQEKLKSSEIKNSVSTNASFADVVAKNLQPENLGKQQSVPDLIIKPKTRQDPKHTKKDIETKINIKNLKVGVKNIKTTNLGSVIIKCQTKREMEILETEVRDKLENSYEVQHTKMRRPKVKITNFNQNTDNIKEIEDGIIEQNDLTKDFKVTYIKKRRTGSHTIYGECSAINFRKLMNSKKIFFGWERYPIYENLEVPRCYQCQGFYHKKENCSKKIICPLCSEEHQEKDCLKQKKCCINCLSSNGKYKLNYATDHHATDLECPTLKYHTLLLRNKTDYTSQWF